MLAVLMVFMTSCASSEARPDSDMVLKINVETDFSNNDSVTPWFNSTTFVTSLIFRSLFTTDPATEEVKPDLAESYTISDDGLTYEFILQENQLWSDGETITAEDVKFSIESTFGWVRVGSIFASAFDAIVGSEEFKNGEADEIIGIVADGQKLTITLNNPIGVFVKVLAQFSILPEHVLGEVPSNEHEEHEYWQDPVVSGMYRFAERTDADSLTYIYNENYSGEPPYISSILFHTDYDIEDFDYFDTNDAYDLFDYRGMSFAKEYKVDSTFYRYFVFNIMKDGEVDPIMGDVRVRNAIVNAIDFKSVVLGTYFSIGNFSDAMEWQEENGIDDVVDLSYNPERARELLLEAEYDFDRPLVLLDYYTDETSERFMSLVGDYLEAVGFQIEFIPFGNLYTEEFDNYDVGLKGLSAFDMSEWYTEYHSSNLLHKEVWGEKAIFDELVEKLLATEDAVEKAEIEKELKILENNEIYKFPIFTMGHMVYINNERVELPEDIVFGNPRYRYDVNFKDWKLVTTK